MLRTLPFALLTMAFLAGVVAVATAHGNGPCAEALDGVTAGAGVALDRLLHGDFGGALDALTAFARH